MDERTFIHQKTGKPTTLETRHWNKWSDREIARRCKVSHPLVIELRKNLTGNITSEAGRTYRTKHGTISTMNTENIGKQANEDNLESDNQRVEAPEPPSEPDLKPSQNRQAYYT